MSYLYGQLKQLQWQHVIVMDHWFIQIVLFLTVHVNIMTLFQCIVYHDITY